MYKMALPFLFSRYDLNLEQIAEQNSAETF